MSSKKWGSQGNSSIYLLLMSHKLRILCSWPTNHLFFAITRTYGVRSYRSLKKSHVKRHGTNSAVPPKLHIWNIYVTQKFNAFVRNFLLVLSEIKLLDDLPCIQTYNLSPHNYISLNPTAITVPITVFIVFILSYDIWKYE